MPITTLSEGSIDGIVWCIVRCIIHRSDPRLLPAYFSSLPIKAAINPLKEFTAFTSKQNQLKMALQFLHQQLINELRWTTALGVISDAHYITLYVPYLWIYQLNIFLPSETVAKVVFEFVIYMTIWWICVLPNKIAQNDHRQSDFERFCLAIGWASNCETHMVEMFITIFSAIFTGFLSS